MVFSGIWYGTKKPKPTLFWELLYREFEIVEKGILVNIPTETSGTISKIIKGILIAGTFDLPGRYSVSGSVQFNGKYGCVKCFQGGESFKTASGGNVWIYPFNKNDTSGTAWDNAGFKLNALEAYHKNKPKFDIKYPAWLYGVGSYDLVNGVGTNYMHGVMLRMMKLMLKLWFSNVHEKMKILVYMTNLLYLIVILLISNQQLR